MIHQIIGIAKIEARIYWRQRGFLVVSIALALLVAVSSFLIGSQITVRDPEVAEALGLAHRYYTWAMLYGTILFMFPIVSSVAFTRDEPMQPILSSMPLTSLTYVIGKVMGLWLALLISLGLIYIASIASWWVLVGQPDFGAITSLWIVGIIPLGLLHTALFVLPTAGFQSNRLAVIAVIILTMGMFFVGAEGLGTLLTKETITVADYLNPMRPILQLNYLSEVGQPLVTEGQIALSHFIALVEVVVVGVLAWWFIQMRRYA